MKAIRASMLNVHATNVCTLGCGGVGWVEGLLVENHPSVVPRLPDTPDGNEIAPSAHLIPLETPKMCNRSHSFHFIHFLLEGSPR